MRHFVLLCLLVLSASAEAAIYGADQRRDIGNLGARWKTAAQGVAVVLPTFWLLDADKDHYYHEEHEQRPYAESVGLCKDEKFANQKSFGHCTAFLVAPNIVVSAGHCFLPTGKVEDEAHSYCENFSFWFGYNNENNPLDLLGSFIPKKNVAHCKKVIYAENNQQTEPEENPIDFAIYELEEPVTHIKPLKVSLKEVRKGQSVTTIGHPHGLPAKFAGFSPLLENYETTLSSFMDTLSGNSGGPAFNSAGQVVGILVSGHQYDTYEDKKSGCDRLNRCDNRGQNCNVDTELENSNLLMKSKVWYPIIQEFLGEDPSDKPQNDILSS